MAIEFKLSNVVRGGLIYAAGDTTAALILEEFSWLRLGGMLFIGATLYAFEIPNYFNWIDKKVSGRQGFNAGMYRTFLAIIYFNPLWIARHLLIIQLLMLQFDQISWNLLYVGFISFVVNIPISIIANYVIQNQIKLDWRFLASAIFSALMAIYYALSTVWFS